jgi:hypothetical protein
MKRIIVITFIIFTFVCKVQSQETLDILLTKYYNLAKTSQDSNLYKEKFFEIFPDNFQLFDSIYGYKDIGIDSTYYSPLYSESLDHIIFFFDIYNIINKSIFIKKVINISLNGHWEVDAINIFQDNLQSLFMDDTKHFLKVLATYKDTEIKSFWNFFFASNNHCGHSYVGELHQKVYKKIKMLNYNHILTLMEEQWQYDYNEYLNLEDETKDN